MIKWITTILICVALWYFTDVRSDNVFQSVLVPLLLAIILIFVVVAVLYKAGILKGQVTPGARGDGSGGYIGGFSGNSGGDGGSSDGGC